MGTRSSIAIKTEDGIKAIYCHWDGYVDHNGKILKEFYKTTDKVEALIALGDISSLREEVGEKHDFDKSDYSTDDDRRSNDRKTFLSHFEEEMKSRTKGKLRF